MSKARPLVQHVQSGLQQDFDYLTNAASAGDCTGLIPTLPQDDAALDSYEALYAYQPPSLKRISEHEDSNQIL